MHNALHNVGLIARREYLQRVRTKAFLFTTLLVPLMTAGFALAPMYFATSQFGEQRDLVVVSDDAPLAQTFQQRLEGNAENNGKSEGTKLNYNVTIEPEAGAATRERLDSALANQSIYGYVWLTREALQQGRVQFHTRNSADLFGRAHIEDAVNFVAIQNRLAARGVSNLDVSTLLKSVELETVRAGGKKTNSDNTYLFGFMLVFAMYLPVVIQVVAVMRSVIEEKTSRVMEVMLATVTPKELMAGKIIGVGGVGLTQVLIWSGMGLAVTFGSAAASGLLRGVNFTGAMIAYFIIFYLLGYLLYSAFAAALGAAVNSEEEAQQLQFFVMLPLILSMMLIGIIFSAPSSGAAIGLSLFPFFAPLLMYLRVVLEQPPFWQLALCVALLAITAYAVLVVCARIYRVGILMYGKRPTLPEILKWVRYA
jgi:ABC-2 type transport system permease protein